MKKIAIVLALVMGQLAFAAQAEARRGHHHHHRHGGGGAGAIIGLGIGIAIGLAAADDDEESTWVCRAHNARGGTFRAVSHSPRKAKARVLAACDEVSRKCWFDGCTERY